MASTNIDIKVAQLESLDVRELTTKELTGTGVFDVLMSSVSLHIQEEYSKGRIRGPEYSQVYLGGLQATLSSSVEYLTRSKTLGIEISNQEKQGLLIEAQIELAKAQANQVTTETTIKLPAEVDNIKASTELSAVNADRVEAETLIVPKQGEVIDQQIAESTYRLTNLLPKELEQITAQIANLGIQGTLTSAQKDAITAETTTRLPAEVASIQANTLLTDVNKDRVREELTLIPLQAGMITAQTGQVGTQTELVAKQIDQLTAELAKIPIEVQILEKQVVNATTQNELLLAQVEGTDLQNSKVPKEIILLDKQASQVDASVQLSTAQKDQLVAETVQRLPVEVLNLTKQGDNLVAQKALTTAQTAQTTEQTKRMPYDIEEIQARIANMTKQNLLLEKDVDLRIGQLALQQKQLLLSEAELDVKRQEIQVQLAAIDSQRAQADLYTQKVVTERAQTEGSVVGEGSVLGANVAVLLAQADGYKSDKLQKATKILVDTWNVRRQSDDATEANIQNQLHDSNIGVLVTGLMADAGLIPKAPGT